MSQEDLARVLSVTFQQVQKYEKGTNRISAGRLQEIARILTVPIHFFYEDCPETGDAAAELEAAMLVRFMGMPEMVSFVRIMNGFKNPKIRHSMRDLAMAVAEEIRDNSSPKEKP
jgi:transcriptional regulator with XRE-family HTH domain